MISLGLCFSSEVSKFFYAHHVTLNENKNGAKSRPRTSRAHANSFGRLRVGSCSSWRKRLVQKFFLLKLTTCLLLTSTTWRVKNNWKNKKNKKINFSRGRKKSNFDLCFVMTSDRRWNGILESVFSISLWWWKSSWKQVHIFLVSLNSDWCISASILAASKFACSFVSWRKIRKNVPMDFKTAIWVFCDL